MRFYSAGNMYLSSIQQGIQAAHCVGEMTLEHTGNTMFEDWLSIHKTLICLNGGNNKSLNEFWELVRYQKQFPVAKFHEDEQSMAGMLTCVGIIVPEKIYGADLDDPYLVDRLGHDGVDIATALKRMPLAR
jgi:hypothetical protein